MYTKTFIMSFISPCVQFYIAINIPKEDGMPLFSCNMSEHPFQIIFACCVNICFVLLSVSVCVCVCISLI